jgi:hydrogenase-1 operon protein HyaF
MQQYGVPRAPAVVFLRDGQFVGVLNGIRDWREYQNEVDPAARTARPNPSRSAFPSVAAHQSRSLRMNPSTMRPFPISVVAMGPGSQGEEAPGLPRPCRKGMETFSQPRLPDNVPHWIWWRQSGRQPARCLCRSVRESRLCRRRTRSNLLSDLEMRRCATSSTSRSASAKSAPLPRRPQHWRVQETAFSGIWRVLKVADDGRDGQIDRLETGAIPAALTETMNGVTSKRRPAGTRIYPAG